jgi:hypothetical protein
MRLVLLLFLGLLAACTGTPPGVRPVAAGVSRADGIVTMASTGTIYNPVSPDWRVAEAKASRQCRRWGHPDASSFAGWQEACRVYDIHGRCTRTTVTRFYSCDADG